MSRRSRAALDTCGAKSKASGASALAILACNVAGGRALADIWEILALADRERRQAMLAVCGTASDKNHRVRKFQAISHVRCIGIEHPTCQPRKFSFTAEHVWQLAEVEHQLTAARS